MIFFFSHLQLTESVVIKGNMNSHRQLGVIVHQKCSVSGLLIKDKIIFITNSRKYFLESFIVFSTNAIGGNSN